jgi:hypothetical protein
MVEAGLTMKIKSKQGLMIHLIHRLNHSLGACRWQMEMCVD